MGRATGLAACLLAAAFAGGLVACGAASDDGVAHSTADGASSDVVAIDRDDPGHLRFDLTSASTAHFFDFPYPSDLRLNAAGAPDLSAFRTDLALLELLALGIEGVEAGVAGFSPLSSVYVGFRYAVDPTTLPQDRAEAMAPDASAFVMDITPDSPTFGQRLPVLVDFRVDPVGYWEPNTLVLSPSYQLPPRPATTYAAVVTTAVRGADGSSLSPPGVLRALAAGESATTPVGAALAPVVAALADQGVAPETLLAVTAYTTSDPASELDALRGWMRAELPAPVVSGLERTTTKAKYTVYEGTFSSEEFFSGVSPYAEFGDGAFRLGADGAPADRTPVDLMFALTVPTGEMPEGGWPIVLYGHGLGEDYLGFVPLAGKGLAQRGVAALGINPPLQGDRNPTDKTDYDLVVELSIHNIVAGREILRQGVCDELQALRLVEGGLEIPGELTPTGEPARFDAAKVAYMGHSEGAQIGALLLGVEPTIGAGVFSAGGGGAAITMVELKLQGLDVAALVAQGLGVDADAEGFDLNHPVVSVVIQPLLDVADPLHSARRILLEPPPPFAPHDLAMLEGFLDALTPPPSTEALASAMGLPIAEPVARPIEGLDLQGVGSVTLPAEGNVVTTDGLGVSTGALLQHPEEDHYIIYFNAAVRAQLFDFLASSFDGPAVLEALAE